MNRLSIRMILFIVVLSALHISASRPMVLSRDSLSSRRAIGPLHVNWTEEQR